MKGLFAATLLLIGLAGNVLGASPEHSYYSRSSFLLAPSSSYRDGLLGFANPANLAFLKNPELRFHWSSEGVDAGSFGNWGAFAVAPMPILGVSILHSEYGEFSVTDYHLSMGAGNPSQSMGLGFSWSSGDDDAVGRERLLTLGMVSRPCRYFSLGLVGNMSVESKWSEVVAEVGLRPLAMPLVTLFADGALERDDKLKDAPWSAGLAVEPLAGVSMVGRYFEDESFTLGLAFNFAVEGLTAQARYDDQQKLSRYTYSVRVGGPQPSFLPGLTDRGKRFVPMTMKGVVDYNKYVYFDDGTLRLMDLLRTIQNAAEDPRVAAIVMNLSGMRIREEHAWEIREELRKARQAGLTVIIFIDTPGMCQYHLASVADHIVIDPEGWLILPGFVLGRTYVKGTLEKLGLGFDEWRLFKYKSAGERYSRDHMSDADREQFKAYNDDRYELVRQDVCEARGLSVADFDGMVDDSAIILAHRAVESGLVDTLARWSDKEAVIKNLIGRPLGGIAADDLFANAIPSREWGSKPKVAVVYGLGACAMDEGIRARWLEGVFKRLAGAPAVKAVVFRVDSPGGEGLASDLVAQALRECAERKPVIVSQGQVAGSGGYWISMYGDTILAGPNTVTGSIGVWGGWIYDKGFSEKTGLSSDHVRRGKHADIFFGPRVPILNVQLPGRNLTPEERGIIERIIMEHYDAFTQKVADGRDMSVDSIRQIAEGRFYSGVEGKKIGLVDDIGGLMAALVIARQKARLSPEREVDILEIPDSKGLFRMPRVSPGIPISIEQAELYEYLKLYSKNPWLPLPMLLPGTYPGLDQ